MTFVPASFPSDRLPRHHALPSAERQLFQFSCCKGHQVQLSNLQVGLAKILSREQTQVSMQSTFDWAAPEVCTAFLLSFTCLDLLTVYAKKFLEQ